MQKDPNIFCAGFEGPNKVGKSYQMLMVGNLLSRNHIPYLKVKGEGTRPLSEVIPNDPTLTWWEERPQLTSRDRSKPRWEEASYRLGQELVFFRDEILPNMIENHNGNPKFGVLLVDRTLLSRALIPIEGKVDNVYESLYPNSARIDGQIISPEDVCPDITFNLHAPKDELLRRLKLSDPRFKFRKELIEKKHDWYLKAVEQMPENLRSRFLPIDASGSKEEVYSSISSILKKSLIRRFGVALQD